MLLVSYMGFENVQQKLTLKDQDDIKQSHFYLQMSLNPISHGGRGERIPSPSELSFIAL